MAKFGRAPFSRRFGGGVDPLETAHLAMLEVLAPGYAENQQEIPEDSPVFAEAYAHALAVTMIWRLNGRLRNSLVPMKMLETLTTWEQACKLRPALTDNVWARRRRLAAKFRGLVGNTLKDIYDAIANLCPQNFLGLKGPDASQDVTYWPGINPGPPGFEWSSTRAIVAVRLQRAGLSDSDFAALVGQIALTLDGILPVWMGFQIGTDEGGFIAGVAIAGVTLLGGP